MRKIRLIALSLIIILLLGGCTSNEEPVLKGFYQSEKDTNGYVIQMSIQQDDSSFIQYINNREVDKGTYEKAENNIHKMRTENQNFEITLDDENSFDIVIRKLNSGNPIKMKNINNVPAYFKTRFDDVDKYKTLIE